MQPFYSSIQDLPGWQGFAFNPTALVQTVNRLQQQGERKALEILRLFLARAGQRLESHPENAVMVARVLFTLKSGGSPPRLLLGRPDVQEPQDPSLFPLFPLAVHADIPFLLVGGYYIAGQAEPPSEYLDWCEAHSELRSKPLHPDDDPLRSLDEFLASQAWRGLQADAAHDQMLRLQALRAVATVYPIGEREAAELLSVSEPAAAQAAWERHRRNFLELRASWNPLLGDYEA